MWKSAVILILGLALAAIKDSHGHPHTGSHEDDRLSENIEFLKRFLERELSTDDSTESPNEEDNVIFIASQEDDKRSQDSCLLREFLQQRHLGGEGEHGGSHEIDRRGQDSCLLREFLKREMGIEGSHDGPHHDSHEHDRRSQDNSCLLRQFLERELGPHEHHGSHEDDRRNQDIDMLNEFLQREMATVDDGGSHASHEHDRRSPDVDIFEQLRERMRELGFNGRTVSETLEDQLESERKYYEIDEKEFLDQEHEYATVAERDSLIVVEAAPQNENEPEISCPSNQYRCPNEAVCLKSGKLCDGRSDCQDRSDENLAMCQDFYQTLCRKNAKYFCWSGSKPVCLLRGKMCDGNQECDDGSDESQAECEAMPKCWRYKTKGRNAYSQCSGSLQCLWYSKWCNGQEECVNGADEADCVESEEESETGSEPDLDAICGNNKVCRESILAHNYLRSAHEDTPPVTWNQDFADKAQAWADECIKNKRWEYSTRRQNRGENILYMRNAKFAYPIAASVGKWYNQQFSHYYDYSTGTASLTPQWFAQVVWDDTIEIGCGIAKNDVDTFIVCQYAPSIALPNEYTAHIRPPKAGIDILGRMRSVGLYVEENIQPKSQVME